MKYLYDALESDLARVRSELELYDVLVAALETTYATDADLLRRYTSRARRVTYSTTIVSCYGVVEQTVDSILMGIVESYVRIYPKHSDLPEEIRANYRDLVLDCLRDGERVRIRRPIEPNAAIVSLIQNSTDAPDLTSSVFTRSTANYRLDYVKAMFSRVGAKLMDEKLEPAPLSALSATGFANYDSFLGELVQRRNDLTHSYGDSDIIEPRALVDYVQVVEEILQAIISSAVFSVLRVIKHFRLECLGIIVRVWTGRVGIQMTAGSVRKGDRLLIIKEKWATSHEILSLESEGNRKNEFIYTSEEINLSAALGHVPGNCENAFAYVMPSEWNDFWPSEFK